ncbi:MAG: hypothetical protein ACR2QQ_10535 [Gammaproteobacteria bacterium]
MRLVDAQFSLATLIGVLSIGSCTVDETPTVSTGIELEIEGTGERLSALPDIQAELSQIGVGVWPLLLEDVPEDLRRLLNQENLTDAETTRLRDYFLLSRERLLEIVAASGRTPNVPGGGALETTVLNQGYSYPQLWEVQNGVDYTRFDRFHVNVSDDGIGVDEVLQMVSGEGVVVRVRQPNGTVHNLRLDCPNDSACWMFSYDAGQSHVGSLSSATPGTKLVVQAFGPTEWALRYTDEEG